MTSVPTRGPRKACIYVLKFSVLAVYLAIVFSFFMKIAIVGSGYVGLVAAACLAEVGHQVVCVDNDAQKLRALHAGEVPIFEDYLPELLERHRGKGLRFSGSLREALQHATVVFIAVGTPASQGGAADLSFVEAVAREIGQELERDTVVVEKSTVPVYTCEWIQKVISMTSRAGCGFDVVSNPEFLREGTAVTDFLYPDRIVIGADSPRSAKVMSELYAPLVSGEYYEKPSAIPRPDRAKTPPPLVLTSTKSAELIKHASNAFLAMKISFINAVANLCEAVSADVSQVCHGIGLDSRIGTRFLQPGVGYGGSCFPKDVKAFRTVAEECGYDFGLLNEVMRINDEQRQRFLKKVRNALWNLKGKRLGVLGLAFKGGTDDIRESPAIEIVRTLVKEGCEVAAYDPAAMERAAAELPKQVEFVTSACEAAKGADALLILTDWEDFRSLDLEKLRQALRQPILIDGRNLYAPEKVAAAGLQYVSIGRPVAYPKTAARAGSAPGGE